MSNWTRHIVTALGVGAACGALLGLREGSLIIANQATHVAGMGDLVGFVVRSLFLHVSLGAACFAPLGVLAALLDAGRRTETTTASLIAVHTSLFAALFAAMLLGWIRAEWIDEHLMSGRFSAAAVCCAVIAVTVACWAAIRLPVVRRSPGAWPAAARRALVVVVVLLTVGSLPLARLQALDVASTGSGDRPDPIGPCPNVLWISLCTVRADHLSAYGYHRDTSPTLTALAERGVLFDRAVSPSCWTRPSHASLFTGAFLSKHGVDSERQRIPEAALTATEVMRQSGYQTVGVTNNYNAGSHVGIDRGFDLFVEVWGPLERNMLVPHWYHQIRADLWNIRLNMCSAGETNHILTTWFDRHRDDSRPFFCFVNYAEAHDPYLPPPAIATQYLPDDVSFAEAQAYCQAAFIRHGKQVSSSVPITPEGLEIMQAMYDAELRYQDDRLGELLTALDERGLLDDTIIVAVGDHGEHFGEHGLIGHENSLYEPLLHVPMLVVYPGHVPAGVRDQRLAQTTDVLPTTLALCGIEAPVLAPQLQGSALFTDVETAGANTAIAEFALTTEDAKRMMREGSWKLIDAAAEPDELYDLEADPDETRNIYAEESGRATRLAADLDQFSQSSLAMTEEGDQIELGEEALRMLRSLGYVGD